MIINTDNLKPKYAAHIRQALEMSDAHVELEYVVNLMLDFFPALGKSTDDSIPCLLQKVFISYKEMLSMLKDAQVIIQDEYPESKWDVYSVPKRQYVIDKAEAMIAKTAEEVIEYLPPKETAEEQINQLAGCKVAESIKEAIKLINDNNGFAAVGDLLALMEYIEQR